jgi:hypothetical protein
MMPDIRLLLSTRWAHSANGARQCTMILAILSTIIQLVLLAVPAQRIKD